MAIVRAAREEDIPRILELYQQLAQFLDQKLDDQSSAAATCLSSSYRKGLADGRAESDASTGSENCFRPADPVKVVTAHFSDSSTDVIVVPSDIDDGVIADHFRQVQESIVSKTGHHFIEIVNGHAGSPSSWREHQKSVKQP